MSAILDIDLIGGGNVRANVSVLCRNRCKAVIRVYLCNKLSRSLYSRAVLGNSCADLAEDIVLKLAELVRCTKNLCLHLLQFLGDISFAVGKRLLSDISVGNHGYLRLCDLYIESEYTVVSDLESLYTSGVSLVLSDLLLPLVSMLDYASVLIDLGIKAVCYHSALTYGKGRILLDRAIDECANILKRVKLLVNALHLVGLAFADKLFKLGQYSCAVCNGTKISCVSCTVNDLGHKTLKVKHLVKKLADLLAEYKAVVKLLDSILSAGDLGGIYKRVLYPSAQKSRAEG